MHIPERRCIACRHKGPKEDFFRVVVLGKSGEPFFDRTGKADGRGAYICKNASCIMAAQNKNALSRAFKRSVGSEIYEILTEELCEG